MAHLWGKVPTIQCLRYSFFVSLLFQRLRRYITAGCSQQRALSLAFPSTMVVLRRLSMLHYIECLALVWTLSLASVVAGSPSQNPLPLQNAKPNVVFVLSDDQDLHMDSLSYMPFVQEHLIDEGTFYRRHFCTIALCCPSRVSLWTGKAAHNTNVTDVSPPYGTVLAH